jgi:uncharacterized lipoprotein NlpE involved in copper resistance
MKKNFTILAFSVFLLIFTGCNSGQKKVDASKDTYRYVEKKAELTGVLKKKVGSWAKEGKICYGVIVATNSKGKAEYGKPVKARIILIDSDRIKMKSLEDINLGEKKGCSKLSVSSGTTWWEKDGDLFKTKQEAISFLKEKGLYK